MIGLRYNSICTSLMFLGELNFRMVKTCLKNVKPREIAQDWARVFGQNNELPSVSL